MSTLPVISDHDDDPIPLITDPMLSDPDPAENIVNADEQFNLFKAKGLHILHLNVRSLPNKLDELRRVARLTKAAIIGITETWLDDCIRDPEKEEVSVCTSAVT